MAALDDDLDDILYAGDELADVVSWSGPSFRAFLHLSDASVLDGRATAADAQLQYPAAVSLPVGADLVIRGRRYRVVDDPERFGDGRERLATLREL